jgi:hypothetical protein
MVHLQPSLQQGIPCGMLTSCSLYHVHIADVSSGMENLGLHLHLPPMRDAPMHGTAYNLALGAAEMLSIHLLLVPHDRADPV